MKRYYPTNIFRIILITFSVLTLLHSPLSAEPIKTAVDYFNEASEHYAKRDYGEAIRSYTKAIELNPKFAEAYYGRGSAAAMLNAYDKALADFDKVLEIDPADVEANYNKGLTYEIIGENEKALAEYKHFVENAHFQVPDGIIEQAKRKIKKLELKIEREQALKKGEKKGAH